MLHKTRGIVLKTTGYSESSVIVQVFTEKFGMQSYLINGVKRPRARITMNMLQPLRLLDMIVYHKPAGNIQRISELRCDPVFENIPFDLIKSSLAIFLDEVLYKSIRFHSSDERMFEFVFKSIEMLDNTDKGLANFHLWFMMQLSRYLGFYPGARRKDASCFDLLEGVFSPGMPLHVHVIDSDLIQYFISILNCSAEGLEALRLPSSARRDLLEKILEYYALHIENFGNIKSHIVLEEVLR